MRIGLLLLMFFNILFIDVNRCDAACNKVSNRQHCPNNIFSLSCLKLFLLAYNRNLINDYNKKMTHYTFKRFIVTVNVAGNTFSPSSR